MATKIFYNDNRIIIDGHADTPQECQAITAMCDSLANDENFKTIVYESGHAVFEQVSGGESAMFAMQKYVLLSKYNSEVGENYPTAEGVVRDRLQTLEDNYNQINYVLGNIYEADLIESKGQVLDRLDALEAMSSRLDALESTLTSFQLLTSRVAALENKSTKALPYTADELIAKLENI